MNGLKIFESEKFGQIRTTVKDGEPWFVAADVCTALKIANNRDALTRIDDDEKGVMLIDTPGGKQKMTIVNESGLYSLVLGSRKPEAKAFKRWILHEVIPTIRKTGGYVNNDDLFINTYLPYADDSTKALFQSTLATVRNLNAKIEADKPKVLFADSVGVSDNCILIGVLAKLIKQNGYDIGQNRLFKWLRGNNYLTKTNMPTQYSMDLSLFKVKERAINNPDGSVKITRTTLVTGKGQQYFINKFLGN